MEISRAEKRDLAKILEIQRICYACEAERYELFTGSESHDNIRLYERAGYRQYSAIPASERYCRIYLEKPGKASTRQLSLGVDIAGIGDYGEYRGLWKRLPRIEATMVEKNEECRHELGEKLVFDSPYDRPSGICQALCHVFQLYLWRLSLGFPSWNGEDRSVYRLHCPDPKGTVWELRAAPRINEAAPQINTAVPSRQERL
jgi:uncharacterized repeat protein (TIGR04076 family)